MSFFVEKEIKSRRRCQVRFSGAYVSFVTLHWPTHSAHFLESRIARDWDKLQELVSRSMLHLNLERSR